MLIIASHLFTFYKNGVIITEVLYSTRISLDLIDIRKDNHHYIVENKTTGEFFEMPQICIDAINKINEGTSLKKIEDDLKNSYPDEDVDIIDFVNQLIEQGIVKELDGVLINQPKVIKDNDLGLKFISPAVGRLFFNPFTAKGYIAIILINIFIFLFNPTFFPTYKDFFPFELMSINIIFYIAMSFILVFIHELGHVLAIRAHGLPTRVELGHRLYMIVLQTDMTPAWRLTPKKRNTLYLAGLYFDNLILFIALTAQLLFPLNPIATGILGVVVLDVILRIVFQCCFYMKTDLYYIFENMTGSYNVMENGKRYLNKWLPFLKYEKHSQTFDGEERTVKWYAYFYLSGVTITFVMLFVFFIPQIIYGFEQVAPGFLMPLTSYYFWDAVVFVLQFVIIMGLLLYSWLKNYQVKQ